MPTRFIRDLLRDTQCPVLIVPQKFKPLQKIILLYDDGPSAVHEIKMFSYLLPQLKHLKEQKENAIVVLGACRRGTVNRSFRESMADILVK